MEGGGGLETLESIRALGIKTLVIWTGCLFLNADIQKKLNAEQKY